MALLNYTTTISVTQTVGEIQSLLAKNGARSIQVDYDDNGEPCALAFSVQTPMGQHAYRLPANIDAAFRILRSRPEKYRAQKKGLPDRAQAARVAWRILKDWIEAHMALIDLSMSTLPEIMLPWMIAGRDGETVYQLFERRQLALPSGD